MTDAAVVSDAFDPLARTDIAAVWMMVDAAVVTRADGTLRMSRVVAVHVHVAAAGTHAVRPRRMGHVAVVMRDAVGSLLITHVAVEAPASDVMTDADQPAVGLTVSLAGQRCW